MSEIGSDVLYIVAFQSLLTSKEAIRFLSVEVKVWLWCQLLHLSYTHTFKGVSDAWPTDGVIWNKVGYPTIISNLERFVAL